MCFSVRPGDSVLISGGRSPVALEMARLFGRSGYRVFVVESEGANLCSLSKYVSQCFRVASPRFRSEAFIEGLLELVERFQVNLFVPTCEEVFCVSQFADRFPQGCRVLAVEWAWMERLHRKDSFVEVARGFGLRVPETKPVRDLKTFSTKVRLVLKPVYSRFGGEVKVVDSLARGSVARGAGKEGREWIAQEYLSGSEVHYFGVVSKGEILVGVCYRGLASKGAAGPSIVFEEVESRSVSDWVANFVERSGISGLVSFDFILTQEGDAVAIECNPRVTSGVHLLARKRGLLAAMVEGIRPVSEGSLHPRPVGLRLACWLLGRRVKVAYDDVVAERGDVWPVLSQCWVLIYFSVKAMLKRVSLEEALVSDLKWDGERMRNG